MWEYITTMISSMFTDRLWIWTALAGATFGALFIAYMRNTRIAVWVYGKWDAMIDFFRDRYGWTWLNQDLGAWRKVHPQLTKEIEDTPRVGLINLKTKNKEMNMSWLKDRLKEKVNPRWTRFSSSWFNYLILR